MSARNNARTDMATRVQNFCKDKENAKKLLLIPGFDLEETDIGTLLLRLSDAAKLKNTDTTGIATDKDLKWQTMAINMEMYCGRAYPFAYRAGATNLVQVLSHPITYFTEEQAETSYNRAAATATAICDVDALKILTNILPADVVIINKVIADFGLVRNAPASTIHNKKASGTELEDSILDEIELCVENMRKYIHSYYRGSAFATEFDLTSRVIILGIRHNPVNIQLLDAVTLLPITNGTATKTKFKIVGNTNAEGVVPFDTCASGIQSFLAEAPNYIPQEVSARIMPASLTELIVKMKKI